MKHVQSNRIHKTKLNITKASRKKQSKVNLKSQLITCKENKPKQKIAHISR